VYPKKVISRGAGAWGEEGALVTQRRRARTGHRIRWRSGGRWGDQWSRRGVTWDGHR